MTRGLPQSPSVFASQGNSMDYKMGNVRVGRGV